MKITVTHEFSRENERSEFQMFERRYMMHDTLVEMYYRIRSELKHGRARSEAEIQLLEDLRAMIIEGLGDLEY